MSRIKSKFDYLFVIIYFTGTIFFSNEVVRKCIIEYSWEYKILGYIF